MHTFIFQCVRMEWGKYICWAINFISMAEKAFWWYVHSPQVGDNCSMTIWHTVPAPMPQLCTFPNALYHLFPAWLHLWLMFSFWCLDNTGSSQPALTYYLLQSHLSLCCSFASPHACLEVFRTFQGLNPVLLENINFPPFSGWHRFPLVFCPYICLPILFSVPLLFLH